VLLVDSTCAALACTSICSTGPEAPSVTSTRRSLATSTTTPDTFMLCGKLACLTVTS
jgi:hypothetical protein